MSKPTKNLMLTTMPESGNQSSLSRRERAGVRENATERLRSGHRNAAFTPLHRASGFEPCLTAGEADVEAASRPRSFFITRFNFGIPFQSFLFCLSLLTAAALANNLPADRASLEGQELARELTTIEPSQSLTNTGVLVIRDKQRGEVRVPVRMMIQLGADGWTTTYQTLTTDTNYLAALVIRQAPARPNRYEIRAGNAAASLTEAQPAALPVTGLMTPFAGSDFWVADLGLEFLRWPQQRLLRKELRRGQSCNVLESAQTNAAAGGYTRVVSWIDIDTGGIVEAEAYDAAGKLMKQFYPRSFQDINGRKELKRIEMRNKQSDSITELQFDRPATDP